MLDQPFVQTAYFVNDARQAALAMNHLHGAGPFFLVRRIELAWCELRGASGTFVHTSAYGQMHGIMLELVQQDEEGPSPFRDLFAPGEQGLHHQAMMVDSLEDTYRFVDASGLTLAARAQTETGTEFAFIDTVATHGHMIEVYERSDALLDFYRMVREAAAGWDGQDPVRVLR